MIPFGRYVRSVPVPVLIIAFLIFSGFASPASVRVAAAEPVPLELGVLPYINLEGLLRAYGPLAQYLERELGRPVRVVTARDYPHLLEQTARRAYPLLITASHFARLAQRDTGYLPLLRPLTTFHEILIVGKDSPLRRVEDLKGRVVAIPDSLAQVTMMARRQLRAHGLEPDQDVTLREAKGHLNAVYTVLNGGADAAVVSEGGFRHMKEDIKHKMRELDPAPAWDAARLEAIPVVYMASPALAVEERDRLARLMARFANEVPEGQAWINQLKYDGLRPPTEAEMATNDMFVDDLRRLMASSPPARP